MTNILKFGILMLLLLVAHQNSYCYYPYSSHVYGLGNPVNFIDPSGMTVIATSEEAQEMIKNTLPKDAREFLKFDENGVLDAAVLSGYSNESESQNFSNLLEMALSDEYTFEVYMSDTLDYNSQDGKHETYPLGEIEFDPDTSPILTGESGWIGHFGIPGRQRLLNSTNNNLQITVNSGLSTEGAAQSLSHELYGHGYMYLTTNGNLKLSLHNPINNRDNNEVLTKQIQRSIDETVKNMHK